MTTTTADIAASTASPARPVSRRRRTRARTRRPLALWIYGGLAGLLVLLGLVGPWLVGDVTTNVMTQRLLPPGSAGHLLGTDGQGRDVLARVVAGARPSMVSALLPVAIGALVGSAIGILAAMGPGWLHSLIMRTADVFYAFPAVLLAIAIAAALGPGTMTTVISLSVVLVPPIARIAETETMRLKGMDFMEAAYASGAGTFAIARRQVLTNVLPTLLVYATSLIGLALVFAGGMSFLGLGVAPPHPEWGQMINEQRQNMYTAPMTALIPALVIFGASLVFNQLGDALRDVLDVRRKGR
ncbi:ABC transporter permease [Nocardioides humi]|uniref:ABC transporter permease n=1 Tax=Nocardioides humi TaxID=449461 RepID=A0ABN1ZTV2_9ACTN|nr:ABC transporter permease [Nocardioides humi]